MNDVLSRGFPAHQLHLVDGSPGTGKTTLAVQFLLAGRERGEAVLYVTLSETRRELVAVAHSHGWNLDGIHIHEMEPLEEGLAPERQVTLFHPSDLELSETTSKVLKTVEAIQPSRVAFDSLSEMRLLAQSSLRYRRQILGLKQFSTCPRPAASRRPGPPTRRHGLFIGRTRSRGCGTGESGCGDGSMPGSDGGRSRSTSSFTPWTVNVTPRSVNGEPRVKGDTALRETRSAPGKGVRALTPSPLPVPRARPPRERGAPSRPRTKRPRFLDEPS